MDLQLLMKTAMRAGSVLLMSGAETYRVEDTMRRMFETAPNLEEAQILVLMTGITATVKLKDSKAVTAIKRVESRSMNLRNIVYVNKISRRYCQGLIDLDEAASLLSVDMTAHVTYSQLSISVMGICLGFALFFGGNLTDSLCALIVGFVLALSMKITEKLQFQDFLGDIIASFFVAVSSIALYIACDSQFDIDIVMISCIMPLVPGVAITNAVRDLMRGDYISGSARVMEALLCAVGVALGILVGITFMDKLYLYIPLS